MQPQGSLIPRARPRRPRVRGRQLRSSLYWLNINGIMGGVFVAVIYGGCVPVLLQFVGLSDRLYGILMALPVSAAFIQLPTSIYLARFGRRKQVLTVTGYISRLGWIPLVLLPVFWPGIPGVLVAFVILIALLQLLNGVYTLAWQNWMADLIPPRKRGAYFGKRARLVNIAILLVSLAAVAALPAESTGSRMKWALLGLFVFAALCGATQTVLYRGVADVPFVRSDKRHWLDEHLQPLRDAAFRRFLWLGMAVAASNAFVGPFLYKHCLETLNLGSRKTLLILQSVPVIMGMVAGPWWGYCLDRFGRKATLSVALWGAAVAGLGWLTVRPNIWWLGLITTAVLQVFWTGVDLGFLSMSLRWASTSPRGRGGSAYFAVYSVGLATMGLCGGYLAGELAQRASHAAWVAQLDHALTPWHLEFGPYLLAALVGLGIQMFAVGVLLPRVPRDVPSPTLQNVRFLADHAWSTVTQLLPGFNRD